MIELKRLLIEYKVWPFISSAIYIFLSLLTPMSIAHAESFTWRPDEQQQVKPLELEQYSSDPLARAVSEREKRERQFVGEFVKVPGGTFRMGDLFRDGEYDEKQVHRVSIKPFELGKYEVTQKQWEAVMGRNPSYFSGCASCPVERVSWDDVQEFIGKLKEMTGNRYRLPTEAEWEYACRSGGKEEKYCGGSRFESLAWYRGNSNGKTHRVGEKQPNRLGLYDMSGNVREWVQDCWNDSYSGAPSDGTAWRDGDCGLAVVRGGSWNARPWTIRSANRYGHYGFNRHDGSGFRLARDN